MIPVETKNDALNGETITHLSLHTAWPGVTGSNEITGGSPAYARKAVTLAAASGGQRVTTAAVTFDVPASTINWIGMWNGSAFRGAMPNGGATSKNFSAILSTDTLVSTAHGWSDGTKVAFFNGTPPGGLTEGVVYNTLDSTADTFKVAPATGGTAIDLTSGASFGCVVGEVVQIVKTAQDTHQVTTVTLAVPD
jgi:hypothetical protein